MTELHRSVKEKSGIVAGRRVLCQSDGLGVQLMIASKRLGGARTYQNAVGLVGLSFQPINQTRFQTKAAINGF